MQTPRVPLDVLTRGVEKLPACGEILPKLRRLLANPDLDPMDLAALVRLDAGLASRVLRLSNTVFFSGGRPIQSVEEAVIRVGYVSIGNLLTQSVFFELMAGPLRVYSLAAGDLWRESILCAVSMELLGSETKRSTDICYTVGLLHGVGMIVIDRYLRENGSPRPVMGSPWEKDVTDREREWVGFDHAEVGAALLADWGFPESITASIRFQHAPASCRAFPRLAGLLHLALWLKGAAAPTFGSQHGKPAPEEYPIRLAGFSLAQLQSLVPEAQRRFRHVEELVVAP